MQQLPLAAGDHQPLRWSTSSRRLKKPNFRGARSISSSSWRWGTATSANYDKGFYNIGVRRSSEDAGRDATAPASTPQRSAAGVRKPARWPQAISAVLRGAGDLEVENKLPDDVLRFIQLDPVTLKAGAGLDRQAIHGNFKAPNLRNSSSPAPIFTMVIRPRCVRSWSSTRAAETSRTPTSGPGPRYLRHSAACVSGVSPAPRKYGRIW